SKLTYQPAVRQMIIEHDRITASVVLADTSKTGPNGRNTIRSQNGIAGGFIKDLITFVDDLHILRQTDGAVGVRRCAATAHAGKRNAVECTDGKRYVWPFTAED